MSARFGTNDLLACYRRGVFPMGDARDDPNLFLVDPDMRGILPLDGFQPSDPFTGDDLRHTVKFGGKPDVSSLKDKAITLRFTLKSASLYSFAFRN